MKVLYVAKSQVSAAYQGLPRELSQLGVELTVVVPPRWGSQRLENVEVSGYNMRVLPCAMSGKNHFHFYTRLIEDEGFDLIHLDEEPWSLVTYQWVRRARSWKKPLIFFTWQNIEKQYPFPFAAWERDTFAYASAAIAGSREAETVLRRKGFTGPVTVFPEVGVDPNVFCRKDSSVLRRRWQMESKIVIGFAGRMIAEKGILDLVRAFALLPEDSALLMIGAGDQRVEAEALGRQLGVGGRIRWMAPVPSLQMPEYMSLMDVLVLP
ncbi:MAG: glycosyltransferase, partial [Acidobacteriales bacterium]|nr:glycosyltransferase [Terriglobales bacterium]